MNPSFYPLVFRASFFCNIYAVLSNFSFVTFYKDQCDSIITKICPAKSDMKNTKFPLPGEVELVTNILLTMVNPFISSAFILFKGRKVPYHIADSKHILTLLKSPNDFPPEMKAIVFKVLSQLFSEAPENVITFHIIINFTEQLTENIDLFYNAMQKHFEDLITDPTPSKNILLCFPNLCKPDFRLKVIVYGKYFNLPSVYQ